MHSVYDLGYVYKWMQVAMAFSGLWGLKLSQWGDGEPQRNGTKLYHPLQGYDDYATAQGHPIPNVWTSHTNVWTSHTNVCKPRSCYTC